MTTFFRVREAKSRNVVELCELEITKVKLKDTIYIKDLCLFEKLKSDFYLIGLISEFRFMEQQCWKEIAYYKNYVEINKCYGKIMYVLCRWLSIDFNDRILVLCPVDYHGYIDINQYHLTIPAPENVNGKFLLSKDILMKLFNTYNQLKTKTSNYI